VRGQVGNRSTYISGLAVESGCEIGACVKKQVQAKVQDYSSGRRKI